MEQIFINGKSVPAERGVLLSKVLQENSDFKMPCAGGGNCGKCKVQVSGQLSDPDSAELRLLTEEELAAGVRLACRTRVQGPAQVNWTGRQIAGIALGPAAQTEQSAGQLQQERLDGPMAGQKAGGPAPLFVRLGVAVDIGTTTLAARLYDKNGLLAQAGCDNPQGAFGADVISRIGRSLAGEGPALARAVRRGINELLERLCREATGRIAPGQIDTLVITGNTTMLYLLTERDPDCLSHAPFQADWLAGEWVTGRSLDLICPKARVWLPPCVSAFVGADTVTALLAAHILHGESPRLLVDIGTNGEIALWNQGTLTCCSTAAGPAFEGAGLTMGMQGETGAISHVKYVAGEARPMFLTEVIGDTAPKGICGSGVVDAVYCLLQSGRMDDTGYLEEETVVIAGNVVMTQEDVRKVQLAKSAICAGIEVLLQHQGLEVWQLKELLVAGGFGSFLDLDSARGIGLLPGQLPQVTTVCGNGALTGAAGILLEREELQEAKRIAACTQPVNLAVDEAFMEKYVENMFFR